MKREPHVWPKVEGREMTWPPPGFRLYSIRAPNTVLIENPVTREIMWIKHDRHKEPTP